MSKIFVQSFGNGVASVDDDNPEPNQLVTLTCIPYAGENLERVIATDSHDYSIAMSNDLVQQFRFRSAWGSMYIECYFTGSTPPPEPPFMNWLIPILKKRIDDNMRLHN